MATLPTSTDLAGWTAVELEQMRVTLAQEQERRRIIADAPVLVEQIAQQFSTAVKDQPAKAFAAGTVVGPGQKVTEGGTEYVNVSGAFLSVSPSQYPMGYQLTKAPTGAPAWDPNGKAYKVGDLFTYKGTVYKVIQAHSSQSGWLPDSVAALYSKA